MVSIKYQAAMRTIVDTNRQVFGNKRTTTGAPLRCVLGVDEHHLPTSVYSFVGSELYELTPGYIRHATVDRHDVRLYPLNVQILKNNELIFIDQLTRLLLSKVATAIGRPCIGVTKSVNHLTTFGTALRKLLFLALKSGHVAGVNLHPTLAGNFLAVAEIGKGRQA